MRFIKYLRTTQFVGLRFERAHCRKRVLGFKVSRVQVNDLRSFYKHGNFNANAESRWVNHKNWSYPPIDPSAPLILITGKKRGTWRPTHPPVADHSMAECFPVWQNSHSNCRTAQMSSTVGLPGYRRSGNRRVSALCGYQRGQKAVVADEVSPRRDPAAVGVARVDGTLL